MMNDFYPMFCNSPQSCHKDSIPTVASKRIHLFFCIALTLIIACFCSMTDASAATYIYDEAMLLDDEALEETIISICADIEQKYDTTIYILTRNSVPNENYKRYLEDYADAEEVTNAVFLLIDMGGRGFEIQGYGSAEFAVDDNTIENTLDDMMPYMSDGDYGMAIYTFVTDVEYACRYFNYENYENNPDQYVPHTEKSVSAGDIFSNPLVQLVICVIIALIILAIMISNSGGKVTTNPGTYLDRSSSRVLARYDHYVRTTTTKRRKPSNNSGGGSHHGGGVSSGGRSHSGGGRSF